VPLAPHIPRHRGLGALDAPEPLTLPQLIAPLRSDVSVVEVVVVDRLHGDQCVPPDPRVKILSRLVGGG
jgi:hypothetical protein